MYEQRARAAALLFAGAAGGFLASLCVLWQVPEPPPVLSFLLGLGLGLSAIFMGGSAAAWRVNHKEGN